MKILVTGATGFIGYHCAARLLAEGHGVRVLARNAVKAEHVLGPLGIGAGERVIGDMTDAGAVARALAGCEAVVHCAAGVSVTTGQTDFSDNLRGTQAVIGGACARRLPALYVSSLLAVYDPKQPMTAELPLVRSKTHYGRSKIEADAWVRAQQEQDTASAVAILYPSGVIGPDDPGLSESVKACRSFLRGTLRSEGGIHSVDARDLALLVTRMVEAGTRGRIVAAGHFLDWDELTAILEVRTGAKISRITAPGWLLRGAARAMDVVGKLTGRSMPMTGEGIEIATRFRPIPDTPEVAALGVTWRDPAETVADTFAWLVAAGRLPARAVPALAPGTGP